MSSKTSVEEKDRETIEMVRHEPRPTRIDQIEFGLFSGSDMKRLSSLNVRNNDFHEMGTRTPGKERLFGSETRCFQQSNEMYDM